MFPGVFLIPLNGVNLPTLLCINCTIQDCTLPSLYFYILKYAVYSALHSFLCIAQFPVHCTVSCALHSLLCIAQFTVHYTVLSALHSLPCIAQFTVHCTVYKALYSLQC